MIKMVGPSMMNSFTIVMVMIQRIFVMGLKKLKKALSQFHSGDESLDEDVGDGGDAICDVDNCEVICDVDSI